MSNELFVAEDAIVKPGQPLARESDAFMTGEGVLVEGGMLRASRLGHLTVHRDSGKTVLKVASLLQKEGSSASKKTSMHINDVIIGKVIKVNEGSAKVRLLAINDVPVAHEYIATLKRENMRNRDIDAIDVEQMFAPNDIILARVKALNESKNINLSTEEDRFGVIFSYSENRNRLLPVSGDRMQSPVSKREVWKKVACLEATKDIQ